MTRRKFILFVPIFSLMLTAMGGIVGGLPLRFLQPVVCIQMIGANCPPFTVHWASFLGDFVFWLIITMIGYVAIKIFSKIALPPFVSRKDVFVFFVFLLIFAALPITIFLTQERQEIRTKAQLPNCQSLTYPCQEGLISFPNDEGKHRDKQVEWWYANFNVNTSPGFIPLAGAIALVRANPGRGDQGYALLEITDEGVPPPKFFYRVLTGTITSSIGKQDVSFTADPGTEVENIRFYQSGEDFQYKLEITGDGVEIILTLKSQKRPLVEGGDGYVPIFADYPSEESGYYSLTKLLVSNGQVDLPDTPPFAINGISWIDHQWFNVPTGISPSYDPSLLRPNHEWFSIQLDNNVQIVAWEILKGTFPNLTVALKNLDIIDDTGTQTHYEDFTLDPYAYWNSSDGRFAQAWRLQQGSEIDLTIQTTIPDQYVAPYKTYEGSTTISGKYKGINVQGQGFAEMTLKYNPSCSPLPEICDGIDNDCDFRVDEFCQLLPTPTPTPTPIPGDFNQDRRVDILDLRYVLSNFTNIFDYNLVVGNFGTRQQCLKYSTLVAQGLIKILVVPAYFSDVKDEIVNHEKRVGVYFDAFNEINIYLSKIQQDRIGKKILDLDFELSRPIAATQQPTYFELNATNIKTEIKSQLPEIDLEDYQIIIFRALTNISTNTNGYNLGNVIWINRNWTSDAPIPEKIEYIENNNQHALHLYRGILTSLTLHEILHSFGMSDGEGARVNVFFTGGIYDGTQTLFYKDLGSDLRDVDVNTGIFQDIGLSVSREIGWSDTNNNGILDVEEFCKK